MRYLSLKERPRVERTCKRCGAPFITRRTGWEEEDGLPQYPERCGVCDLKVAALIALRRAQAFEKKIPARVAARDRNVAKFRAAKAKREGDVTFKEFEHREKDE